MSRLRAAVWLLAALCLLPGCAGKGARLYQRAEQFLIAGQPRLAAEEYRRLATDEPRSPLADDALYKLAFLYRSEMNAVPEAIATYELLADRYPHSPFADDSLLWVMFLQSRKLKDPAASRRTFDTICQRYPEAGDIRARAHLQLVQALLAAGDAAGADGEAQRLIAQFPDQPRQAAAAMLVRARLAPSLTKKPETAVKLYEQIINTYPGSLSAVEAKRAIGWAYYGERGKQAQAERLAKVRAARMISGVPGFTASGGAPRARPFAALRSLLAHRGVAVTGEELLAVSGAAFEFTYSPTDPDATTTSLSHNALTLAAESYGFAANTWSAPAAQASFASLTQSIQQGTPVMVPANGGTWLIVTGYRPAEDRVYVLPGSRGLSREQFLGRWARSTRGHTDCVTGPYYQFSLGQRLRQPTAPEIVKAAARRAAAAANQSASGGSARGLAAYDLLTEQVAAASGGDARAASGLRAWAQRGLPTLLADRQAAAAYLGGPAQAAGGADRARDAAAAYGEVIELGGQLRQALLSLTVPAQGAEPPPEASWPEVSDVVRQMRSAEARAANELAALGS